MGTPLDLAAALLTGGAFFTATVGRGCLGTLFTYEVVWGGGGTPVAMGN